MHGQACTQHGTYDLQRVQDTLFNHIAVLSSAGVIAHVELSSVLFQKSTDNHGSFFTGVLDDRSGRSGDSGLDDGYTELLVEVGNLQVVQDQRGFL
jgi:hypothetical protein